MKKTVRSNFTCALLIWWFQSFWQFRSILIVRGPFWWLFRYFDRVRSILIEFDDISMDISSILMVISIVIFDGHFDGHSREWAHRVCLPKVSTSPVAHGNGNKLSPFLFLNLFHKLPLCCSCERLLIEPIPKWLQRTRRRRMDGRLAKQKSPCLRKDIISGAVPASMAPKDVYNMHDEYKKWPYENFPMNLRNLRKTWRIYERRLETNMSACGVIALHMDTTLTAWRLFDRMLLPILHHGTGQMQCGFSNKTLIMKDTRQWHLKTYTRRETNISSLIWRRFGTTSTKRKTPEWNARLALRGSKQGHQMDSF